MNGNREKLIAGLTEDLAPVRSFHARDGILWVSLALVATIAAIAAFEGIWMGAFAGEAAPFFWMTNGLLLILGLAACGAVIAMASPGVGNRRDAPKWSAAMLAVLPTTAAIGIASSGRGASAMFDHSTVHCLTSSLAASLFTGVALVLWLRRGAPVSTNAAGWFTGVAAGAVGTLVYGFSCTMDTVTHLGIWHSVPVAIAAIAGRFVVPRLIRW